MKVYRKLTISLKNNRVIEEDSYDYNGHVALCCGGGGGTQIVEKSPIPREFSALATQLGQFLGGTPGTPAHWERQVVGYEGEGSPVYGDVWVPEKPGEPGRALTPTPYAGTYSDMYQNLLRAQQQMQYPTAAERAIQTGVQTGYMYPYAGQLDPIAQLSQYQMAATGAPYNLTAAFMGSYPAYQAALDAALAQAKESASMGGGLRGSAGAQYMGQAAAGTTADFLKYLSGVSQQSYEAAQARRQAAIQQAAQQAVQQQAAWEAAAGRIGQYIPMAYEAATWPTQTQAQQLAQAMQLGQALETTGTYPWLSFIQSLIGTPQAQYIAAPEGPGALSQVGSLATSAAAAAAIYKLIASLAACWIVNELYGWSPAGILLRYDVNIIWPTSRLGRIANRLYRKFGIRIANFIAQKGIMARATRRILDKAFKWELNRIIKRGLICL